ncbi:MAG: cytochrome c biogenesis protein CcdA [Hyphomicrobiaceae bacterium]|nr:cytochrome c biogenesis protein CcdA [Hyphomicrobiaceae bacterium]
MSLAALGLALLAGALSTLSPCVLPLLPIVVGTAATEHRHGPLALAAGLALSFTAIGLFVATVGFAIGLDSSLFRSVAAVLMAAIGVVLLVPVLQEHVAVAAGPAGNWVQARFGGASGVGLGGQFAVGLVLGAVWSPCAGPTLGAASVLASQGTRLLEVAGTMALFGLGAALPLLLLGMLSRESMLRLRGRLLAAGSGLRAAMGIVLIGIGAAVLTGTDKALETWLVERSPAWLTWLTTSV